MNREFHGCTCAASVFFGSAVFGFQGRVLFLIVFSGLKDEMLEGSENLPDPDVLVIDIVEDLEAAREPFREITAKLGNEVVRSEKTSPLHMVPYAS